PAGRGIGEAGEHSGQEEGADYPCDGPLKPLLLPRWVPVGVADAIGRQANMRQPPLTPPPRKTTTAQRSSRAVRANTTPKRRASFAPVRRGPARRPPWSRPYGSRRNKPMRHPAPPLYSASDHC